MQRASDDVLPRTADPFTPQRYQHLTFRSISFLALSKHFECFAVSMPFVLDDIAATGSFSPLKSNLEDMVRACEKLEWELEFVVDDGEIYGLITEDTFLENAPVCHSRNAGVRALISKGNSQASRKDLRNRAQLHS